MKTSIWTILLGAMLLIGCTAAPSESPAPAENTEESTAIVETDTTETDSEPETADASNNNEAITEESDEPELEEEQEEPEEMVEDTEEIAEESEDSADSSIIPMLFLEPAQTDGEILILYGQVLATDGTSQADTAVEIWQTDQIGVYDHPDDPGTNDRDRSFQFFGTAVTDADGWFVFRTILPGEYEPRPRHIHFKIKQDGQTLLTSQLYFSDDIADVEDEGMFAAVGDQGDLLLLQLVQGDTTILAQAQIVIDTGIGSGELPLTPSQAEGPFYPVVPLADYDNDLVILP